MPENLIKRRFQPLPLLGSRQAAFPEDNQPRMKIDVQQRHEIARVGSDYDESVLICVLPNLQIASAGQADMRSGDGVHALSLSAPGHNSGRELLVDQQFHDLRRCVSAAESGRPLRLNRIGFLGRPGFPFILAWIAAKLRSAGDSVG